MNINDYGYQAGNINEPAGSIPARVVAVHKERYAVVCDYGQVYARLKPGAYYHGAEEFPTAGDFVLLAYNPTGDSRILSTLPRRSFFSRRDPDRGRGEQAVAANFDYVFIMQSMNLDFNPKRLERYLTVAWQSGAVPVILLTKADLADDPGAYILAAEGAAPGVAVHGVSAKTGQGLEALEVYFRPGKTVVFLGSSGVGKSSLVNALAGEEIMSVSGIREDDSKGRHTTTHRQLLMLPSGAMVIDTPGMRELGMWDAAQGLGDTFTDVEQYLGKCRFRDCSHGSEPGCAIKAAIADGSLDSKRWERYRNLKQEAEYAEDRDSMMKRKREWSKGVAKFSRQRKKEIW